MSVDLSVNQFKNLKIIQLDTTASKRYDESKSINKNSAFTLDDMIFKYHLSQNLNELLEKL